MKLFAPARVPTKSPRRNVRSRAAMERDVGETALELRIEMIMLATCRQWEPLFSVCWHGLGRDGHVHDVAGAGSPNLAKDAPAFSGALITTVTALCVASTAMFGLQCFWHETFRGMIVQKGNFAPNLHPIRAQIRRAQRPRWRASRDEVIPGKRSENRSIPQQISKVTSTGSFDSLRMTRRKDEVIPLAEFFHAKTKSTSPRCSISLLLLLLFYAH